MSAYYQNDIYKKYLLDTKKKKLKKFCWENWFIIKVLLKKNLSWLFII